MKKPLIGLTCDFKILGERPFHGVNEKYSASVTDAMSGVPVLIPLLSNRASDSGTQNLDLQALLENLDGIIFTGSYSNVEPKHYHTTSRPGTLHDPQRDSMTLPFIPMAIAAGVPLLAICRGFQEMNVAYGGSLHQHVHELEDKFDHRENIELDYSMQYAHAHPVTLAKDGLLLQAYGQAQAQVNSLHSQGVDRLGAGLQVEATANDGLIEAFTDPNASAFNLGVQWHPEYQVTQDPFYLAIYNQFAQACNKRRAIRD